MCLPKFSHTCLPFLVQLFRRGHTGGPQQHCAHVTCRWRLHPVLPDHFTAYFAACVSPLVTLLQVEQQHGERGWAPGPLLFGSWPSYWLSHLCPREQACIGISACDWSELTYDQLIYSRQFTLLCMPCYLANNRHAIGEICKRYDAVGIWTCNRQITGLVP